MRQGWVEELPVLGIRVRFASASSAVRQVVNAAFGPWRGLDSRLVTGTGVTVRFHVHDGEEDTGDHAPVQYWTPGTHLLVAQTTGSIAIADAARREATAHVSRDLVRDTAHFRYTFVEALTLFLVSSLDRGPFHCAALVRDGRTVLLSGQPGVGKSTLAYAAMRRGFRIFAEDMVWVQQRPRLTLWGMVSAVHLPPDARRFFPELKHVASTLLANGQRKISVSVTPRARPPTPVTTEAIVCLLGRSRGRARLRPIGREALERALGRSLQAGFDRFPDAVDAVVASFARRGAWRLTLGADPFGALSLLDNILAVP